MKSKRTLVIILLIILLAFTAAVIYLDISNQSKTLSQQTNGSYEPNEDMSSSTGTVSNSVNTEPESVKVSPRTFGNSQGNIYNGGYFAMQNNYIYFSYVDNKTRKGFNLSKSRPDASTSLTELYNRQASCINIIDQWIYFINSQGAICKVNLAGDNFTIVKTGKFYSLLAFDNQLYFMEKSNIYVMPIDDSNNVSLIASNAISFTISDDGKNLFYLEQSLELTNRSVYQISLKNLQSKLLIKSSEQSTFIGLYTHKNSLFVQGLFFEQIAYIPVEKINIIKIDIPSAAVVDDKYLSINSEMYTQFNVAGGNLLAVTYDNAALSIYKKDLENGSQEKLKFDTNNFEPVNFYAFDSKLYILMRDFINSELWIYDFSTRNLKRNTFYDLYFLIN